jgi:hypothetical protein
MRPEHAASKKKATFQVPARKAARTNKTKSLIGALRSVHEARPKNSASNTNTTASASMNNSNSATSPLEAALASVSISNLWNRLNLPGRPDKYCVSPLLKDKGAKLNIWKDSRGREQYRNCATGDRGGVVEFLAKYLGCTRSEACKKLIEIAGTGNPNRPSNTLALIPSREFKSVPALPKEPPGIHHLPVEGRFMPDGTLEAVARTLGWVVDGQPVITGLGYSSLKCLFSMWVRDAGKPKIAWCVTDMRRVNATARLLNGEPFTDSISTVVQVEGSDQTWALGTGNFTHETKLVLFVDGAQDLLAARAFISQIGPFHKEEITAVCMTGGTKEIHPAALRHFKGKKVIIYPHLDSAAEGDGRALRWGRQLAASGAEVFIENIPSISSSGCRNLNELWIDGLVSGKHADLSTAIYETFAHVA